jgi:hypothetical protein
MIIDYIDRQDPRGYRSYYTLNGNNYLIQNFASLIDDPGTNWTIIYPTNAEPI